MLGIIGAMDEEVAKIKEIMQNVTITKKAGMEFFQGELEGRETVVVKSGIGKVNAAVCAQILVDLFSVSALINTGIAGSLRSEINIGDIVLSTDALHHDMDTTSFGDPIGQVPGLDVLAFEADKVLLKLAMDCCEKVTKDRSVYAGRIVSGDQFIAKRVLKDFLVQTFDAYCTEMEGAAVAQTAYLNKVPFVIIRAISDKADNSAHMDYPEFKALAIENSVKIMKEMAGRYEWKK